MQGRRNQHLPHQSGNPQVFGSRCRLAAPLRRATRGQQGSRRLPANRRRAPLVALCSWANGRCATTRGPRLALAFRTGITSVVPSLVGSVSRSQATTREVAGPSREESTNVGGASFLVVPSGSCAGMPVAMRSGALRSARNQGPVGTTPPVEVARMLASCP
jgi:hypothetical protein